MPASPNPYPVLKVEKIDEKDVGTPDEWIPRHPDLIRLTGRHPFNVEPPLPTLMKHGFLTPASLCAAPPPRALGAGRAAARPLRRTRARDRRRARRSSSLAGTTFATTAPRRSSSGLPTS